MDTENAMCDSIVSCLTHQISEFELLKSMYPNHDEIVLLDSKILDNMQNFIDNKSEYTPSHLDFTLNIFINNLKLEICINLPTFYPDEEPDIYVRCNQLNRQQESSLNSELTNYIKTNHTGEVCLYTAISWVQENIDIFINQLTVDRQNSTQQSIDESLAEGKFVRLWIYSSHIYNKKKRDEILKKAKDLNLTGFCLPGKPGIICIEGLDTDCREWWKEIKTMSWKKIMIRKTETYQLSDQQKHQKFDTFEEIHFHNTALHLCRHIDMAGFSKFMEEHQLSQAFNDFFGLCGDMGQIKL